MPLLKPVLRSRVSCSLRRLEVAVGVNIHKPGKKATRTKPKSIKAHLAMLRTNKQRLLLKDLHYLRDPLRKAATRENFQKQGKIRRNGKPKVKLEYVKRMNDYSGVITADEYKVLEQEAELGSYDWDKFGTRSKR